MEHGCVLFARHAAGESVSQHKVTLKKGGGPRQTSSGGVPAPTEDGPPQRAGRTAKFEKRRQMAGNLNWPGPRSSERSALARPANHERDLQFPASARPTNSRDLNGGGFDPPV